MTTDELSSQLAARLTDLWNEPVTVSGLVQLTAGASRQTWSVTARTAGGETRRLILLSDVRLSQARDITVEAAALRAARLAGVPVPALHDVGDGSGPVPRRYLLMEHVDGETIPRRLLRDDEFAAARSVLAGQLGTAAARIHGASLEGLGHLERVADPVDRLRTRYGHYQEISPAMQIGLRWLHENRPPVAGPGLVHGDFRMGNIIVDRTGLQAVIDWELAHLGDPLEDLGWVCSKVWRFGSPHPVAGTGSRAELLDAYAQTAGWRPTDEQLHWWEVYGTVQWGLMCHLQADRHLSGEERSVELAAIGRRACEQDFDLLLLLGHTARQDGADVLDDPPAGPDNSPHGRPDLVELVDAVECYVAEEVVPNVDAAVGFHGRVTINVLRQIRRQLLLGDAQRAEHRRRLTALGCPDDAALGRGIADGTLDDRWDQVVDTVRDSVRDQLLVANPRHLSR